MEEMVGYVRRNVIGIGRVDGHVGVFGKGLVDTLEHMLDGVVSDILEARFAECEELEP